MTWDELSSTFQTALEKGSDLAEAGAGFVSQAKAVLGSGAPGPTPSPAPAPAPGAAEADTFETTDEGAGILDRLADALGVSRSAVKWSAYGLVAVVVGYIVVRFVLRRGK